MSTKESDAGMLPANPATEETSMAKMKLKRSAMVLSALDRASIADTPCALLSFQNDSK